MPSKKEIDLFIFDLDGTLIDSKTDIVTAVNKIIESFGKPRLPAETIAEFVGTGVRPLVETVLKDLGENAERESIERFRTFYFEEMTKNTRVFEGVTETLNHFNAKRKVILTNKSNLFVEPLMKHLEIHHYFMGFYGRESFSHMKPHPEPIEKILEKYSGSNDSTLMVGDTDVDISCGKSAKVLTCAVTFGFGKREKLQSFHPDWMIENFSEMVNLFQ
jgi:phosphoglycolate phosphatase